uniref:Uncharacterized protein n=1 Tax=Rhizophora mucronata TaxID=61149 RepID=A0A2P2PRV8_RHIMU
MPKLFDHLMSLVAIWRKNCFAITETQRFAGKMI